MPGFGLLTINGNADLKAKKATDIISSQTVARKIYEKTISHEATQRSILNSEYMYS